MARKAASRKTATKIVDVSHQLRCKVGVGLIREEVWVDGKGNVVKYNLAFINHLICNGDNGRVLGYDNAHGYHERHFMGTAEQTDFENYGETVQRFYDEVAELKEKGK